MKREGELTVRTCGMLLKFVPKFNLEDTYPIATILERVQLLELALLPPRLALHVLQEALRKMDEGSYGLCEGCGGWIAFARLEQRPEAVLCGECAR